MVTDNYDNAFVFYTLCSYNSVLINHVHTTHTTHKNHSIVEMVERISVYSDSLNQSNASEYFMRNNAIHYDPNTGSYKNVREKLEWSAHCTRQPLKDKKVKGETV